MSGLLSGVYLTATLLPYMAKIPDIALAEKLAELDAQMAEPNFYSDQRKAAEVSREHLRVSGLVEVRGLPQCAKADCGK